MKRTIISIIRRNQFLYGIFRNIYCKLLFLSELRKRREKIATTNYTWFGYIMKNEKELEKIKKHFKNLKTENTKLLIILNNPKLNIKISEYISTEDAVFVSLDYFNRYKEKLQIPNLKMLNYKEKYSDKEITLIH